MEKDTNKKLTNENTKLLQPDVEQNHELQNENQDYNLQNENQDYNLQNENGSGSEDENRERENKLIRKLTELRDNLRETQNQLLETQVELLKIQNEFTK